MLNRLRAEKHPGVSNFVYWTPRVLGIFFVIFLGLMSLDVFNGAGFWETAVGLFMHNIPALILLVVLIISWKREIVGGVVFVLAGLLYIALLLRNSFEWYFLVWAIQISGVAFLIGGLFLVGWNKKKKLK